MCIYAYIYTHVTTINENEAMYLKENKEGYMWESGGKERERKMFQSWKKKYFKLKKKRMKGNSTFF